MLNWDFFLSDTHSSSLALANYRAGFNECASEVTRVVMSLEGADLQVRTKLLHHLATCCDRATHPEFLPSSTHAPAGVQRTLPQIVDMTEQSPTLPATSQTSLTFKPIENFASSISQYQLVPAVANGQITAILVPALSSISYGAPRLSAELFRPMINTDHKDSLSKTELEFPRQPAKIDAEKVWRPF